MPAVFRQKVDALYFLKKGKSSLSQNLTDAQWDGLCGVVRLYAMDLSLDHAAAKAVDQRKAMDDAVRVTDKFAACLRAIDTQAMGRIVSRRAADMWEESVRPRRTEFNQKEDSIKETLAVAFETAGDADASKTAHRLVAQWRDSGILSPPEPAADFLEMLEEFRQALGLAAETVPEGSRRNDSAFIDFIGRLTDWAKANGLSAWASNQITGHGKFTDLVKEILKEVPKLYEPAPSAEYLDMLEEFRPALRMAAKAELNLWRGSGAADKEERFLLPKQVWRVWENDASLAKAISKAQRSYQRSTARK